jgi:hypothetical protein
MSIVMLLSSASSVFSRHLRPDLSPFGDTLEDRAERAAFFREAVADADRGAGTDLSHKYVSFLEFPHTQGQDTGGKIGYGALELAEVPFPGHEFADYEPCPFLAEQAECGFDGGAERCRLIVADFHYQNIHFFIDLPQ